MKPKKEGIAIKLSLLFSTNKKPLIAQGLLASWHYCQFTYSSSDGYQPNHK
jgi:hypothetical protein